MGLFGTADLKTGYGLDQRFMQLGAMAYTQYSPSQVWRFTGYFGLTRTRYNDELNEGGNETKDTSYGLRSDWALMAEYRPGEWLSFRSLALHSHESVGYSSVSDSKRSFGQTEWKNAIKFAPPNTGADAKETVVRPFGELGISYLSNPGLLDPGATRKLIGDVAVGIEILAKSKRYFVEFNHSEGLSNYRANRLALGINLSF